MIILGVFLVVVLTSEDVLSGTTKYDDDFSFIEIWREIEEEIKQVNHHLRNSIEDQGEYVRPVVKQCEKLATITGNVIKQLEEETIVHEMGDIIFKRVMYLFKEVFNAMHRVGLLHNGFELKSRLIYNLEVTSEHMEQLVYIAKTYCPQLRAVLRTLLVDILKCAQEFPKRAEILEQNVIIYESPNRMISQIKILTEEFTRILNGCEHIEEARIVFRGFTRYLEEIVQKLYVAAIPDIRVTDVTQNLRLMIKTLTEPISYVGSNIERFKKEITAELGDVNDAFERLLALLNTGDCSDALSSFLETVIYFYYYSIKQTHFEIRTAYKISFYRRAKFSEGNGSFGGDPFEIATPKEFVIKIQSLIKKGIPIADRKQFIVPTLERMAAKIDAEIKTGHLLRTEVAMGALSRLLKTEAISKHDFAEIAETVADELANLAVIDKMQDNGFEHLLLKEICVDFLECLRGSLTLASAEALVEEIQKLVNSFNPNDNLITDYCLREFSKLLEYVTDKIDKEVKVGHLPNTKEIMWKFSAYLKIVKSGLDAGEEEQYEFRDVARMVSLELGQVIMTEKIQGGTFEDLVLKDVCLQFLNFFRSISYNLQVYRDKIIF